MNHSIEIECKEFVKYFGVLIEVILHGNTTLTTLALK
jgi:hypothetical protein